MKFLLFVKPINMPFSLFCFQLETLFRTRCAVSGKPGWKGATPPKPYLVPARGGSRVLLFVKHPSHSFGEVAPFHIDPSGKGFSPSIEWRPRRRKGLRPLRGISASEAVPMPGNIPGGDPAVGAAPPSRGCDDTLMEALSNRLAMRATSDTLCGRSREPGRRKAMGTVGETAGAGQGPKRRDLYDDDFYTWAKEQTAALKRRDLEAIDWENVTEEIEALARGDESALRGLYRTIIQHFLKLQYGEGCDTDRGVEWETAVRQARSEIEPLLEDSPGLKVERHRLFREAWKLGRKMAINDFVHHATLHIDDVDTSWGEAQRLRQEWGRLLPQKNPYTRRRVEAPFWLPAPIRLAERPQIREPAARSSSDTP